MQLETCERIDKTEICDLIDLSSPTGLFQNPGTTSSGSKESVANSFRKEMDGYLKSAALVTSHNQDKFQKLNLGRSSSNQSNMSCETVKMRDIHNRSKENTEHSRELQKLVSFVDEEKYFERSLASPADFKDKKETDGESSELSFDCPSMEKFRMMEDHSFIQSTIIDQDMERVEGLLEGWTSDLKKKILAEFSQSKIRLLEYYRQQIASVKEKHDKEISQLKMENDSFKELVENFEISLEKKDETIGDLSSTIQSYKNKIQLQKYFSDWKIKHSEATREKITMGLAARHHDQSLMKKILRTWKSVVCNRIQREKSSQVETEGVIEGLRKEYEDKLQAMNQSLEQSRKEIERLTCLMNVTNDLSKETFAREVCIVDKYTVFQERQHEALVTEKLSKSDGARNIYTSHYQDSTPGHSSCHGPRMPQEEPYFSDPDPSVRKSATIHRRPTTLHYPSKIKANKPKPTKVIPSKKPNRNMSASLLISGLAPPMASVVVERHHPINKETIGQALACKFPVDIVKTKASTQLKKKPGQSAGQLIRVLN